MRSHKCRYHILASLMFFSQLSFGQSAGSDSNYVLYGLIGLGLLLLIWAILNLTDNLMQIEAKKRGADTSKQNFSLFPSLSELFRKAPPSYVGDHNFVRLDKGHDILLEGSAHGAPVVERLTNRVALCPTDYRGIAPIPKVVLEPGEEVLAGQEVFFDKKDPAIKYTSPVSGEIVEIKRGAKRAISEVIILADKDQKHKKFNPPSLDANREELVDFLAESGLWTSINQRPFDVVAERNEVPKNIFISTFDTAPLALDQNLFVEGKGAEFQKGLDVLSKLTSGRVHLGLSANDGASPDPAFANATGVDKHYFQGKHPAGNVGIQIHHIAPIHTNDVVWTLRVQDVISIGHLFLHGTYDGTTHVAIVGSEVIAPIIVKTFKGAAVAELLGENISDENKVRLINGDVLSGKTISEDSFLSSKKELITALKEGDYYELFGWLLPIKPRPTVSRTFPNFLFPNHKFEGDTNTHGERRAFVVSGQYEDVLPMDIYPQHLMKAIMTNDFERMEGLGIAELTEEDVALCEFVCTSKMPVQSILRQGLDMVRDQM